MYPAHDVNARIQGRGSIVTDSSDSSLYRDLCSQLENVRLHGSSGYDRLREELIWNARVWDARSPDCIVRPKSAEEVATVVRLAGESDTKVALRGSGHNYQGAALRDGGIMLDLGGLDHIEIDADAHRAWIGAGVTGGRLIEELSSRGLGFPIGHCSDVAASGYVLSGGFGWNYGAWGPACVNVAAIEMVLANGEKITADTHRHADLFWAARGAGCAFFAAVTGYELILHPLPLKTFAIDAVFEASAASKIALWLNLAGLAAHETVEIICLVGPDHDGRPSITVRAIANGPNLAAARAKLGPLLTPPADAVLLATVKREEVLFNELTKFSAMPKGKRVAADQCWSDAPLGDLLEAVAHLAGVPQATSAISLTGLGGGARTPFMSGDREHALSVGGTRSAGIYALWDGAEHDRLHLDWVASASAALAGLRNGRYVAEADLTLGPDRLAECFTPDALSRLRELRGRYDPDDLFFTCLDV